jgi:hypothetical protein
MDDALAAELAARMERDQAARTQLHAKASDDAVELIGPIDQENTTWHRDVLDRVGWSGRSLVGDEGVRAAWLLAQHADGDPELCLGLPAAAADVGEEHPADLAHLTDRVRRARGKPQLYGTHFWRGAGGTDPLIAQPIEDKEHLDDRRAAMGLEPFEEYTARMLGRPDQTAPSRARRHRRGRPTASRLSAWP